MASGDEETEEPLDVSEKRPDVIKPKGSRQSFDNLRRDLSEEELSSPGVQKMLLDELERLDSEIAELKQVKKNYHNSDKQVAVLNEKLVTHNSLEILSVSTIAVGSIMVGLAYGAWNEEGHEVFILILGALLIVSGLLAKRIKL